MWVQLCLPGDRCWSCISHVSGGSCYQRVLFIKTRLSSVMRISFFFIPFADLHKKKRGVTLFSFLFVLGQGRAFGLGLLCWGFFVCCFVCLNFGNKSSDRFKIYLLWTTFSGTFVSLILAAKPQIISVSLCYKNLVWGWEQTVIAIMHLKPVRRSPFYHFSS